jgi:signal transduction histidine kinase
METLQIAQKQLVEAEKMAALGTLVAGVAHEINTPIGIGVTAASYLQQRTQEISHRYETETMNRSALEKYFEIAHESSEMILQNLQRAAEQIQSFKQVAVDQTSHEKRRFKVKPYIDDLLLSLHPKLKRTKHTVNVQCPENIEIVSYPGAFSQILTNFILNSLLHGFEDIAQGEIVIEMTEEPEFLWLRYSDNGRGMTRDEQSHVFEPFYTTKRAQGGTGLGLHIVYNLVTQQLGGIIHCESTPGTGTTFVIRIPLVENPHPIS